MGIRYPFSALVDRPKLRYSYDYKDPAKPWRLLTKTEEVEVSPSLVEGKWQWEKEVDFETVMSLLKHVPREGLMLELLMWEGSGSALRDTSGQGNVATLYGNVVWETLPNGKPYLRFGGTLSDYALIDSLATPVSNRDITIEYWFQTWGNTRYTTYRHLSVTDPVSGWRFIPYMNSAGFMRCLAHDEYDHIFFHDGEVVILPPTAPTPWYQAVIQLRGGTDYMCGINGYVGDWVVGWTFTIYDLTRVHLGSDYATYNPSKVNIASLRIYNRVLSADEIATLYELGKKTLGLE